MARCILTWFLRDGWWWVDIPGSTGPYKICRQGERPGKDVVVKDTNENGRIMEVKGEYLVIRLRDSRMVTLHKSEVKLAK